MTHEVQEAILQAGQSCLVRSSTAAMSTARSGYRKERLLALARDAREPGGEVVRPARGRYAIRDVDAAPPPRRRNGSATGLTC